jgi:hypothetical protein
MRYHERHRRPPFLGEHKELSRKRPYYIAVERDIVRDPEAVQVREQEQWVFRWLPECVRVLNQCARLIKRRSRLRRCITFGVHQGICQRNLTPDLFATLDGTRRQGRDLSKCARELLDCFD